MGKDMEKSHINGPLPEDWPVRITAALNIKQRWLEANESKGTATGGSIAGKTGGAP